MEKFKQELKDFVELKCYEEKQRSDRSDIGAQWLDVFHFEGVNYNVLIDGFWEKQDWFEANTIYNNENVFIRGDF